MIPPALIVALIIALASAGTGFGAAWKLQSMRHAAEERDRAEQLLENQRLVAKTITRQDQAVIAAVNAGVARSVALRRDSDSARAALVSLHDASEVALRDAASSFSSCVERATTFRELYETMGKAGADLSEKADRHTNDIRTLIEAKPK